MPKKQDKQATRRTQVEELPKQEKELTKEEQQKVKGGAGTSLLIDLSSKPK